MTDNDFTGALNALLDKHDAELTNHIKTIFEQQQALIQQLAADVAALKAEKEQKRGFWSRVFNRKKKDEANIATITGSAMMTQLPDSDIEKLITMSELEKAILRTVIPEAPHAVHSDILREAVAPLLTAGEKTEQRRELHEKAEPLVEHGFVKYFCCMVDSYGLNPIYMGVADHLSEYVGRSLVDGSSKAAL
ncbi:MAG: hypothetical protein ACXV5F_05145 [Halobacteriota archaeon]